MKHIFIITSLLPYFILRWLFANLLYLTLNNFYFSENIDRTFFTLELFKDE